MRRHAGLFYALFTLLTWAAFPVASRVAGTGTLTLFDTLALRLGTAALALSPWWVPRLLRPELRQLPWRRVLAFSAVTGLAYPILAYAALRYAPAVHGAVFLSGLLPVLTSVLVWVWMRELPSAHTRRCLVLVLSGVMLLWLQDLWRNGVHANVLWGDALLVLASGAWALFTVMLKHWKARAFDVTLATVAVASMVYLPVYAFLLPSRITEAPWHEVVFQASFQGFLLPVVAMFTYARAVELLGAVQTVILLAATPVVGALMAWVFLGESLPALALLGALLVFAGSAWSAMNSGKLSK